MKYFREIYTPEKMTMKYCLTRSMSLKLSQKQKTIHYRLITIDKEKRFREFESIQKIAQLFKIHFKSIKEHLNIVFHIWHKSWLKIHLIKENNASIQNKDAPRRPPFMDSENAQTEFSMERGRQICHHYSKLICESRQFIDVTRKIKIHL